MGPCQCHESWVSSAAAASFGLRWKVASPGDRALVEAFLGEGGSGNPSIDTFVQTELIPYCESRYAHTVFLVNGEKPVGFLSTGMGEMKLSHTEALMRNLHAPPSTERVPVLFLHRLGVATPWKGKGLGSLLVLRSFEKLMHTSSYTAATGIALWVEKRNEPAVALYRKLFFEEAPHDKNPKLMLMTVAYDSAAKWVSTSGSLTLSAADKA